MKNSVPLIANKASGGAGCGAAPEPSRRPRPGERLKAFFASRWRGQADLKTVFWRDMLLVGSMVNGATTVASIATLSAGAPAVVAAAVFFTPVPYNVFLFISVWRSAEHRESAARTAARLAAVLWLTAASLL